MKDFVINLLKEELPETFYFHNFKHTLYVVAKAEEIGRHENCTPEELNLLEVASLWHDTGYIKGHKHHEEESCRLARKYLPGYGYSPENVNLICDMIMATKIPHAPVTKLDKILVDADMEYLGTEHAEEQANNLYKEFRRVNPALTREEWNKTELAFLQSHLFFTSFCLINSEPGKKAYLKKVAARPTK